MASIGNLTVAQLRRAIAIKEEIESLEGELAGIEGGGQSSERTPRKRKMSRAGRAAIAAAAKARWAKYRGGKSEAVPKKRRKMSAAGRAKIAAAARARWAKAKAAGKKSL